MLERVSGRRFEDYVAERVLGPLGMTRATAEQPLPAPFAEAHIAGTALTL